MIVRSNQDNGTVNPGIMYNIYWLCYYTVHVFVIIHLCDSIWSFWVEANMYCFYIVCLYIVCHWRFSYPLWEVVIPTHPATFLFLSQENITNVISLGLFVFCGRMWAVIVRLVDIGGIFDNHCLWFPLITIIFSQSTLRKHI